MLETSCLDEAQKNKRAEWGIGAHLQWALLWFKWRKWLPSSTIIHRPSALNFNRPITLPPMLNYGAVNAKHPKANRFMFMFACTSCLGMLEPVRQSWAAWKIFFGLWSERSVFVLDEEETDYLPVSLSKFLRSTQRCLVHPECGWGSILEFNLRLVSQNLKNVWQACGFDHNVIILEVL